MEINKLYQARLLSLKKKGLESGLDTLLICKPENKAYLSGFESSNYIIIITEQYNYILTDSRYIEAAELTKDYLTPILISADYTVFDFMKKIKYKKIGIEDRFITLAFYKELVDNIGSENLIPLSNLVDRQRMVKDLSEISKIRKATKIADKAFLYILDIIKPGITEVEIAFELESKMRKLGASGLSFTTICASGERSSLPHGTATNRKIHSGDLLTLDFGCIYDGYCSDMTRTVGISSIDEEKKKIYNIVLESQKAALSQVKAGKSCADIDSIARSIIEYYGYAEYFGHGLGHGVGLEIHENPVLNPRSEDVLESGMAITIEPGIYLPGKFGVRIEDLLIVKEDGFENLTTSEKNLIII